MDISINYDVKLPETYKRTKWQGLILQFEESGKPFAEIVIKNYEGKNLEKKRYNVAAALNASARKMHRPHIVAHKWGESIYIFNELSDKNAKKGAKK